MSTHVSRRAYYSGRVQGVGFRYSVKRIAAGFEVIGWVRNLADGRVEMEATADPVELDAFLESIRRSHLATHIRQVEHIVVEPPANDVTGFEITH